MLYSDIFYFITLKSLKNLDYLYLFLISGGLKLHNKLSD